MRSTIFRSKAERWTQLCEFSDVKCPFYDWALFPVESSALNYPFFIIICGNFFLPLMNFVMMMEQRAISSGFPSPINHRWLLELLCSLIEFICSTSYITFVLWPTFTLNGKEENVELLLMSFRAKILKHRSFNATQFVVNLISSHVAALFLHHETPRADEI